MEAQGKAPDEAGAGRVLVFARVRPASGYEAGVAPAVEIEEGTGVVKVRNDADAMERVLAGMNAEAALAAAEAKSFTFDSVFPATSSQRDVFMRVGLPVLRECLKGFNGTILAYGQTGSGKTHSLLHQGQKAEEAGLLPRLIASLFLQVAQDGANVYTVEAAAVQVYNEQVDDLLHSEHKSGAGDNLQIQNGGVVPGLTWMTCKRAETMIDAFQRARTNIVYAETKMNKASSRSHAVFQIRITKRERTKGPSSGAQKVECTTARLYVVDLAGSERVKKSGVEGAQFKEATAINKSLLAFGNVVSALAAKKAHIPLRDSKLTRILDGSIGGNCKTALLVCASPAAESASETLSTFDFASRAMRVEVNARVNLSVVEVSAKALLSDLSEDADGLGGLPLGAELLELRRKSTQAAESAKTEAQRKDQAIVEAQKEAKKLLQLVESAEQKGKAWKDEVENLRQSQQVVKGEVDSLKQSLKETEKKGQELQKSAEAKDKQVETLRAAIANAEKSVQEWQTLAKKNEQEAKKEVAHKEVEEVKRQKEEVTRVRMEAKTIAKQASVREEEVKAKLEQTVSRAAVAEDRAEVAAKQAEVAEKQVSELQTQLDDLNSSLEAAHAEVASARKEVVQSHSVSDEQLLAERKKASEALQAAAAEAQALSDRVEELERQNLALQMEVAAQAALLVRRSIALDEARSALEQLKVEADEKQAAMEQDFREEFEALRASHAAEVAALQQQLEHAWAEAARGLAEEQARRRQELAALEARAAAHLARWDEERARLEAEHVAALDAQREAFEAKLTDGRVAFEARRASLETSSEGQRADLQRQLDEQIAQLDEERAKWKAIADEAVQEAWEKGNVQQRRLASAFKAAREITAGKEADLKGAHDDLAKRFASRESREDDVAEIERQRRILDEKNRHLRHREGEVKNLSLHLQNRDETDRLFSQSEFRNRRKTPGGIVPALPGKKVGDNRAFAERDMVRPGAGQSSSSHRPYSSSPLNRTCPGGFGVLGVR